MQRALHQRLEAATLVGLMAILFVCHAGSVAAQEKPATPPSSESALPPKPQSKGFMLTNGGYTLKLGGYIKVDAIYDFDEIGSQDSFDPRTIPTLDGEEPGSNARIHARQTRFNLDVRGPTSNGDVHGFFEGDFFGSNNTNEFRIRHAYGEWGPLLGGQTWSTFMDENAMPETIDFESPIAFPLIRQGQIRATHKFSDGNYAAIAIEDPDSDIIAPAGVPGDAEEPFFDVCGRLHMKHARGHAQLGLFAGQARFDPDNGSPDDETLWGMNLSTKVNTLDRDNAFGQLTYGDGVGRFRGGTTAAPTTGGRLEAVEIFGILLGYEHHWNQEYRSTVAWSWANANAPNGAPPASTTDELSYFAANIIWQFCERAWMGFEYLHGSRETENNREGAANRIQFAIRFDI